MRLELGCPVRCQDGAFGELDDVVIDPTSRRVTHLVVAPVDRHDQARLVSIERARAGTAAAGRGSTEGDAGGDEVEVDGADAGGGEVVVGSGEVVLDCTIAAVQEMEPVQRAAYLRMGELPVEDPNWDVGIEDMLALPYYTGAAGSGLGAGIEPLGSDEHITEVYDRVPKHRVEVRRASAVLSSDDHRLGHVDGLVVDDQELISHMVLEEGHLWGRREITIPIGAIAEIRNDEVTLSLSRDEVGELKSVPVRRWRR